MQCLHTKSDNSFRDSIDTVDREPGLSSLLFDGNRIQPHRGTPHREDRPTLVEDGSRWGFRGPSSCHLDLALYGTVVESDDLAAVASCWCLLGVLCPLLLVVAERFPPVRCIRCSPNRPLGDTWAWEAAARGRDEGGGGGLGKCTSSLGAYAVRRRSCAAATHRTVPAPLARGADPDDVASRGAAPPLWRPRACPAGSQQE